MGKLRPNRKSGQGKHVNLGFLGKYKTYKNTEFKELPTLSKEEEQQLLIDALKPYSYTPSKHRAVKAAGPVGEVTPPETFYLETAQGDALQTAGGDNILYQ